jgi:sugar lactone lactonase YvrE
VSHADDVIPWGSMPSPVTGKRTGRRWLLLALLGVAVLAVTAVTEATVTVRHFLWGGVPLAYVSQGFGTSGAVGLGGFGSPFDTPVVSPDGRTLYVPSGTNSITPVDTDTRKAAPLIRLSGLGSVAAIAITPDSRTLFAAMIVDSSTEPGSPLARVDLRTGRETGQVEVPGGAGNFVMSRDGKTLYVASTFHFIMDRNNNVTRAVHSELYAVNAVTGRIERRLPVPAGVLDDALTMILSPDGGTLYLANVPNSGQYTVTTVSLGTRQPGSIFGLDERPTALAITSDGRTLYVTTSGVQGELRQTGPNTVTAIDTVTSQVRAILPWRAQPMYLTMAPDGKTVWVVSITGSKETTADNTVTPVNVATGQPGPSLHTSGWLNYHDEPSAAAISPDSRTLYVAVRSGLETFSVSLPTRTESHGAAALMNRSRASFSLAMAAGRQSAARAADAATRSSARGRACLGSDGMGTHHQNHARQANPGPAGPRGRCR